MKLKLWIAAAFGILNVEVCGANLVNIGSAEAATGAKMLVSIVTVAPEGDRAESPEVLVSRPRLAPKNSNCIADKNVVIPMVRTASGVTEDSEGVSTAGTPSSMNVTPNAAAAASKEGFPDQQPQ